jgi:hypothetical protein
MKGCLISIFRCGAGSGGRGMTRSLEMRRGGPAVQAARVRARQPRATATPLAVAAGMVRSAGHHLGPRAVGRLSFREEGGLKRSVHRGRCGIDLPNTARGTPKGLADLRRLGLDMSRCREASRPVGPFRPKASRAPSHFCEGIAEEKREGLPGADTKNRGDDARPLFDN